MIGNLLLRLPNFKLGSFNFRSKFCLESIRIALHCGLSSILVYLSCL